MSEADRPAGDVGLGDLIIREGLVPFEHVHECLEIQKHERERTGGARRLGEILIEKGYLTRTQLGSALELQARRRDSGKGAPPRIPGYVLYEEVGRGAMGTIYRARQISVGRTVAIKILPPDLGTDIAFVQRFLREARSVANLSHPNIVTGIDAGEADGIHYYVMEYVEGTNAYELVRRHRRLREEEVIRIGLQIARALDHAHRHGIVHRDVKPHNIIVTPDGTAKLCDLGLAKRTLGPDPSLTADGMAIGTPTYLAPEIALGDRRYDTRADIYSLGVTLYQLATGNPPFLGVLAADVLRKHVNEPPVPPRQLATELSEGFNTVILKMLAKKREDRHQTPAELIRDLEALLAVPAAEAPPAATPLRKVTERRRVTERKSTDRKVTERRITERTARQVHVRRGPRLAPSPGPGIGVTVAVVVAVAFLIVFGVILAPRGSRPGRPPRAASPDVVAPEFPNFGTSTAEAETDRHRRRMSEFAAMREAKPWAETWRWLGERIVEFKGSGFEVLWLRERDRFLESVNESADAAWAKHLERIEGIREPENITRALRTLMSFPEAYRVLQRSDTGVVLTRAGAAYEKLHAELSTRRQHALEPAFTAFDQAMAKADYDQALTLTDNLVAHILGPDDASRLEGMRRRVFNAAVEEVLRHPIRPARIAEGKKRLERLYRRYEFDLRLFPEMDGAIERLDVQYGFALADAVDRFKSEYARALRERIDRLLAARRYWEARRTFIEWLEPGSHPVLQTAIYACVNNDTAMLARLRTPRLLTGREYADAVLEAEAAIAAARQRPELAPVVRFLLDLRALWLLEGLSTRAADGLEKATATDFKSLRTPALKIPRIARVERLAFDPPERLLAFRIHPPAGSPVETTVAPASPASVAAPDVTALARLTRDPAADDLLDLQAFLFMVFSTDRDPQMMEQLESKLKEDRHLIGWDHYTERLATIKPEKSKEPAAAHPPEKELESPPPPLFAVPQIPLDGERIRLVYDMSGERQFEDFRPVRRSVSGTPLEPGKAPGGGMMLSGTGYLYWKATGRGDQTFEIEFDVVRAGASSNFGILVHSPSREQGVVAFAGCTQGKYQGRPPEGLMGIYRLPLENWEDPLRESSRISAEPIKAPLEESGRYMMRFAYSGSNRRYEASLLRQGAKPANLTAELKSRPSERGSMGIWLSDIDIIVRRIVIESALDPLWVKNEKRKTDKD